MTDTPASMFSKRGIRQNRILELLDANSSWEYGLTEDEVREAFNLITTEWTAGES